MLVTSIKEIAGKGLHKVQATWNEKTSERGFKEDNKKRKKASVALFG